MNVETGTVVAAQFLFWEYLFQIFGIGSLHGLAPADCWNWGKWGLKEYKWKGSFLGCFVGLVVPLPEIFVLGCYSWPPKYFFLTVHFFSSFVPIAQQAGQAVVSGSLSINVCLWVNLSYSSLLKYKIDKKNLWCMKRDKNNRSLNLF